MDKRNVKTWYGSDYGPVTGVSSCNPGLRRGPSGGSGGGMHVGGGAWMHNGGVGGGAGMHIGGVGSGAGMHIGGVGRGAGMHIGGAGMHNGGVGGAQASIDGGRLGSVSGGNFTGRGDGQFARGGSRGDHDRHHGHGGKIGLAAGLAAGSALGYGYGGSYDPYTNLGDYDPDYSIDSYGYDDPSYDGYSDSIVSSGADASYCAQRYKSYDPATGTYLGRDGLRHPCP